MNSPQRKKRVKMFVGVFAGGQTSSPHHTLATSFPVTAVTRRR